MKFEHLRKTKMAGKTVERSTELCAPERSAELCAPPPAGAGGLVGAPRLLAQASGLVGAPRLHAS